MTNIRYGDFQVAATPDNIDCFDESCAACIREMSKLSVDKALAAIIENELTESEKIAIKQFWFVGKKVSEIAEYSGVKYDSVRKIMKRAKRKIYTCLKYVLLYNRLCDDTAVLPEEFHFKIISELNGKELLS